MDTSRIDQLLTQLRTASAIASGGTAPGPAAGPAGGTDFARILQASLEQVSGAQQEASKLAAQFELGDPNANLQEVMVSLQKANISFQAMVQVRNKLVSAYHDIMNMQV